MRPEYAQTVPVPIDLCGHALHQAYEMLKEHNGGIKESKRWYTLTVPSQQILSAGVLSLMFRYTLALSPDYMPDEWSLAAYSFEGNTSCICESHVWSPGA